MRTRHFVAASQSYRRCKGESLGLGDLSATTPDLNLLKGKNVGSLLFAKCVLLTCGFVLWLATVKFVYIVGDPKYVKDNLLSVPPNLNVQDMLTSFHACPKPSELYVVIAF